MENNIELLAPAGKWDIMEKVAAAGADAVYLGGKRFNMRLLRPEFNFSDRELKDAVDYLHKQGKKLYVTVNNLYYEDEMAELTDYLVYLQQIGVDAIIVQDYGVVKICQDLGLDINLHASVQMGIGSLAAVRFLEKNSFKRVILSKNLSLQEIAHIHAHTSMGIEFFAHGDLCISHTGQCYFSSFLAGQSGNRGRCIKPCRWSYRLQSGRETSDEYKYWLAHNDLCLYPYVKDLVEAGVTSFKIEGRMRDATYVSNLVKIYRHAIDGYMKEPDEYITDESQYQQLANIRIRDFTSGGLFTRPGLESIGLDGKREPKFPTAPCLQKRLNESDYHDRPVQHWNPHLSVKVGTLESIHNLKDYPVNTFIIGIEGFRQINEKWTAGKIEQAIQLAEVYGKEVVIETPRIVTQEDGDWLQGFMEQLPLDKLGGVMINETSLWDWLDGNKVKILAGSGLNITNAAAANFFLDKGIKGATVSPETSFADIMQVFASNLSLEIIVHGSLCAMVTDYCINGSINSEERSSCKLHCQKGTYRLMDPLGQYYTIRTDSRCRNYIYTPCDLCLFPYLPLLARAGVTRVRIEGQFYSDKLLAQVVRLYSNAITGLRDGKWEQKKPYRELLQTFHGGLTAAVFTGDHESKE
ncbi:peptidase U32 family protein [Syntrophomonas erecta]